MNPPTSKPGKTEADLVPLKQKIAYAMGVVSDHYAMLSLSVFFMPFFNDFLKISASLVGLAMALARVWDAFTDPFVGALSDRCKSRFGRRKPFILAGSVLTGLFFPFIWLASPNWGPTAIFAYVCVILLIYYTFYSIFSVPYESLGSELTPNYSERTNVYVVRSYVQQTFNLGIIWLFPLAAWLATLPWVDGEINGVRLVSILVAACIILAGITPAVHCVERYREIAKGQSKEHFLKELKSLLRNKPLLIVVGIIATYLMAIISSMQLAYYINVYYIYGGSIQDGANLGAIDGSIRFVFSILGAMMIKKLTNHLDKHHILAICVVLLIIALTGMYFTHVPGRPWLALVMKPLFALGEVGFWVLVISMRADTCDWDEYNTGRRREGTISAAANWTIKLTISAAILLGGIMLDHFVGFDPEMPEGMPQAPGTMSRLLLAYTIPPIIALIATLFLIAKYPLTAKRMKEIREELEQRRGMTVNQ